jgi:hypothetical protein
MRITRHAQMMGISLDNKDEIDAFYHIVALAKQLLKKPTEETQKAFDLIQFIILDDKLNTPQESLYIAEDERV